MQGLSSDFEQFFLVKNNLLTSVHNDADATDDYNRVIGIVQLIAFGCANNNNNNNNNNNSKDTTASTSSGKGPLTDTECATPSQKLWNTSYQGAKH